MVCSGDDPGQWNRFASYLGLNYLKTIVIGIKNRSFSIDDFPQIRELSPLLVAAGASRRFKNLIKRDKTSRSYYSVFKFMIIYLLDQWENLLSVYIFLLDLFAYDLSVTASAEVVSYYLNDSIDSNYSGLFRLVSNMLFFSFCSNIVGYIGDISSSLVELSSRLIIQSLIGAKAMVVDPSWSSSNQKRIQAMLSDSSYFYDHSILSTFHNNTWKSVAQMILCIIRLHSYLGVWVTVVCVVVQFSVLRFLARFRLETKEIQNKMRNARQERTAVFTEGLKHSMAMRSIGWTRWFGRYYHSKRSNEVGLQNRVYLKREQLSAIRELASSATIFITVLLSMFGGLNLTRAQVALVLTFTQQLGGCFRRFDSAFTEADNLGMKLKEISCFLNAPEVHATEILQSWKDIDKCGLEDDINDVKTSGKEKKLFRKHLNIVEASMSSMYAKHVHQEAPSTISAAERVYDRAMKWEAMTNLISRAFFSPIILCSTLFPDKLSLLTASLPKGASVPATESLIVLFSRPGKRLAAPTLPPLSFLNQPPFHTKSAPLPISNDPVVVTDTKDIVVSLPECVIGTPAVLGPVSLSVPRGSLVAIVGANGTGKSLLLNALTGVAQLHLTESSSVRSSISSSGEVKIPSIEAFVLGSVAFVSQQAWLYGSSIREMVEFAGSSPELLPLCISAVSLTHDLSSMRAGVNRQIRSLDQVSGGQATRLALARALMSNADTYIFDGLFADLDVSVSAEIWDNCIGWLLARGKSVIFSTQAHRFAFSNRVDHLIVLDHAKIAPAINSETSVGTEKEKNSNIKFVVLAEGKPADILSTLADHSIVKSLVYNAVVFLRTGQTAPLSDSVLDQPVFDTDDSISYHHTITGEEKSALSKYVAAAPSVRSDKPELLHFIQVEQGDTNISEDLKSNALDAISTIQKAISLDPSSSTELEPFSPPLVSEKRSNSSQPYIQVLLAFVPLSLLFYIFLIILLELSGTRQNKQVLRASSSLPNALLYLFTLVSTVILRFLRMLVSRSLVTFLIAKYHDKVITSVMTTSLSTLDLQGSPGHELNLQELLSKDLNELDDWLVGKVDIFVSLFIGVLFSLYRIFVGLPFGLISLALMLVLPSAVLNDSRSRNNLLISSMRAKVNSQLRNLWTLMYSPLLTQFVVSLGTSSPKNVEDASSSASPAAEIVENNEEKVLSAAVVGSYLNFHSHNFVRLETTVMYSNALFRLVSKTISSLIESISIVAIYAARMRGLDAADAHALKHTVMGVPFAVGAVLDQWMKLEKSLLSILRFVSVSAWKSEDEEFRVAQLEMRRSSLPSHYNADQSASAQNHNNGDNGEKDEGESAAKEGEISDRKMKNSRNFVSRFWRFLLGEDESNPQSLEETDAEIDSSQASRRRRLAAKSKSRNFFGNSSVVISPHKQYSKYFFSRSEAPDVSPSAFSVSSAASLASIDPYNLDRDAVDAVNDDVVPTLLEIWERLQLEKPKELWVDNLTMQYETAQQGRGNAHKLALNGLSFHVPAGAKVGVVGRTGSGKSSLFKALLRLFPAIGSVRLLDASTAVVEAGNIAENLDESPLSNGNNFESPRSPITSITDNMLSKSVRYARRRIACVPQSAPLFTGSLRMNLMGPFLVTVRRSQLEALLDAFGTETRLHITDITPEADSATVGLHRGLSLLVRALGLSGWTSFGDPSLNSQGNLKESEWAEVIVDAAGFIRSDEEIQEFLAFRLGELPIFRDLNKHIDFTKVTAGESCLIGLARFELDLLLRFKYVGSETGSSTAESSNARSKRKYRTKDLILLDEPTAPIDSLSKDELMKRLLQRSETCVNDEYAELDPFLHSFCEILAKAGVMTNKDVENRMNAFLEAIYFEFSKPSNGLEVSSQFQKHPDRKLIPSGNKVIRQIGNKYSPRTPVMAFVLRHNIRSEITVDRLKAFIKKDHENGVTLR